MPIIETLQSGFRSLDLFGMNSSSAFYVRGKKRVFSYPGLFLSLAIMAFLIVVSIIFFFNLVNRHSPFVTQSDLRGVVDTEPFYINGGDSSSFNFLIQLMNGNRQWVNDPSYFSMHAYYIHPHENGGYLKAWTPIKECYFEYLNESGYCVSPIYQRTGEPIFVLGHDLSVHYILVIEVMPCDNSTSKVTCASPEAIDEKFRNTILWFHYSDWSIDSQNYEDPMTNYTRTFKMYLSQWQKKHLTVDLRQVEFTSDDSYFFESNRTQKVVTIDSKTFDFSDRVYVSDMYADVSIFSSGSKVVYNRKYKKVQDVLAELTGLVSIIIPIIAFLVLPYVDIKMREALVNECYCIITTNEPNPQPEKRQTDLYLTESKVSKNSKIDDTIKRAHSDQRYDRRDSRAALIPSTNIVSLKQSHAEEPKKDDDPVILTIPHMKDNFNNAKQNQNSKLELCPLKPALVTSRQEQNDDVMLDPGPIIISSEAEKPKKHGIPSSLGDIEATEPKFQSDSESKEQLENQRQQEAPPKSTAPQKRKKKKVGVSLWRWAVSFFRPHPDVKILRKAEDKLLKELDLATMCKKISEIEKLKACLLTREQRILFDSLSTPLIYYDPNADPGSDDAIKIEDWHELGKVSEDDIKVAYSMLKEADTGTVIDRKLISIYEQRAG